MRIASQIVLVLVFLFLSVSVFALDYVFTGQGAWSNPANWARRAVPPRDLKEGNTIMISGNAVTTAECCENDFESNKGTVTISAGSFLTLQNATQFSNFGSFIVLGNLIIKTHFEAYRNSSIAVSASGTVTNQLWIGNQGAITINGGTVNNTAELDNDMDIRTGRIIVNCGSTFINTSAGTIRIGISTFNCGTEIDNSGTVRQ